QIYTLISKKAFDRHKAEANKYELLKKELEHLNLLDPEALEEKQQTLQALEQEQKQLKAQLETVRKASNWILKIQDLKKQQETLEAEVPRLAEAQQKMAVDVERLAQSKKLEIHRETLQQWTKFHDELPKRSNQLLENKRALDKQQQQIDQLAKDIESAHSSVQQHQRQLPEFERQWNKAADCQERMRIRAEQLRELDTELQERGSIYNERKKAVDLALSQEEKLQSQIGSNTSWLKEHVHLEGIKAKLPDLKSALDQFQVAKSQEHQQKEELQRANVQLQKRQQDLDQQSAQITILKAQTAQLLQALEQLHGQPVEDLSALQAQWNNRILTLQKAQVNWEQQVDLLTQWTAQKSSQQQQSESLKKQKANIQVLKESVHKATQNEQFARKEANYKEKVFEQVQQAAGVTAFRDQLKAGEPCPLCGSVHHELSEAFHPEELARAKKEASQSKDALDKAVRSVDKETKHLKEAQQEWLWTSESLEKLEQTLQQLEGRIHISKHLAEAKTKLEQFNQDLKQTESQKSQLDKQVRDLNKAQKSLEQTEAGFQLSTQEQRIQNERVAQLNLQRLANGEQIQQLRQQIEELTRSDQYTFELGHPNAFDQLTESVQQFDQRREQSQKDIESLKHVQDKVQDLTKRQEEEIAIGKAKRASYNQLDGAQKEDQTLISQLIGEQSIAALKLAYQQTEKILQETLEQNRIRFSELRSKQKVEQQVLEQQTKQLESDRSKFQELHQALQAHLKTFRVPDIQSLNHLLLPIERAQAIEAELQELDRQSERLKGQQLSIQKALQEERSKALTTLELAILKRQNQELEQRQETVLKSIGTVRAILNDQAERQAQSKTLQKALIHQRSLLKNWELLNQLIGQADGKRFRVFAQGLTLQRLVQMANQHLINLDSGRYRIRKRAGEGLDLEMIDTYQANHVRSVHTLSGGETFMVSLALALGLSDLAGRNARIESLFIDEGFGTLDQQSLDLAILTLESLEAQGKLIGIISHVPQLKERIYTQVQVEKQGNGYSKIKIRG
ncbi:MAG: SbcC/MukB-like Walker B domain-containing protein, partial [Bacteroidota bacterium]